MNLSVNVHTENHEQPDGVGNHGGLPGVPHEPVVSRHPPADRLVHYVTELALALKLEHDLVLSASENRK